MPEEEGHKAIRLLMGHYYQLGSRLMKTLHSALREFASQNDQEVKRPMLKVDNNNVITMSSQGRLQKGTDTRNFAS